MRLRIEADDDARACWWPAAGRRARARRAASRSCSTNSPGGIAAPVGALGGEQLDDLGRVHHAAAARGDDPLRALVERLQRLGRRIVDLDDHAAPGRGEEAQHAVALAPSGLAHAAAELGELEPEAGRLAREAADDLARLLRVEVHRRPGVAASRRFHCSRRVGLRSPGSARIASNAWTTIRSSSGHADDAAVLVAHRREVAHLGQGDEALVRGFSRADGVEEVDVLRRRAAARARSPASRHSPRRSDIIGCRPRTSLVLGQPAVLAARERPEVDGRRVFVRVTCAKTTRATASGRLRLAERRSRSSTRPRVEVGQHPLPGRDRARVRGDRPQRGGQDVRAPPGREDV